MDKLALSVPDTRIIHTILFDLDETIYPRGTGVMVQLRDLIQRYIQTRFGLSAEEASEMRLRYFQQYGTTLRGLQCNRQIDTEEFLRYVHDIPLHEYLQPNPELDAVLAAIPQQKVIFTNSSREHALGVLDQLGIRHHFVRILDVRSMEYESKPQPAAYRQVCDLLDVRPQECLLVEDNVRNLRPAKALGMTTVLVGKNSSDDSVDYVIGRIEEIGDVVARIAPPKIDPDW